MVGIASTPQRHTLDACPGYRNYRLQWRSDFFANNAQWIQLLSVGCLLGEPSEGSAIAGLLAVTVADINTLLWLTAGP